MNGLACAGLGEMAEREGNLAEAAKLYSQGVGCKGEPGQRGRRLLEDLHYWSEEVAECEHCTVPRGPQVTQGAD